MIKEDDLILALEFITEGAKAVIPEKLSRELFSTEGFMESTKEIQKSSRDWTQGPGIQGLGIGEKITEGKKLKELALRVYVEKKKSKSKVKNLVPEQVDVPEAGKIQTDVIEIGRVETELYTSRVRPAVPGCGVGHPDVTVGTFGCLVRKKGDEKSLYILSNSHVLADEGVARIGDAILQPGDYDGGGTPKDVIGRLTGFQPFTFTYVSYPNLVDAAIAKVRSAKSVDSTIRILGVTPTGISHTVRRGMRVHKVGRTTDYTTGVIQDIHYRLYLKYKRPGYKSSHYTRSGHTRRGRVGLRDQVLCTRYTAGGDSGSVVLNSRNRIVGLHFAGSPSTSIFNRIEHVFTLFDIKLP